MTNLGAKYFLSIEVAKKLLPKKIEVRDVFLTNIFNHNSFSFEEEKLKTTLLEAWKQQNHLLHQDDGYRNWMIDNYPTEKESEEYMEKYLCNLL